MSERSAKNGLPHEHDQAPDDPADGDRFACAHCGIVISLITTRVLAPAKKFADYAAERAQNASPEESAWVAAFENATRVIQPGQLVDQLAQGIADYYDVDEVDRSSRDMAAFLVARIIPPTDTEAALVDLLSNWDDE